MGSSKMSITRVNATDESFWASFYKSGCDSQQQRMRPVSFFTKEAATGLFDTAGNSFVLLVR